MNYPISQLTSVGADLVGIAQKMQSLAAEANSINASISSCYGHGGVSGRVAAVGSKMHSQADTVSHLGQVSSEAARIYMRAEDTICTTVYSRSGEIYSRPVESAPAESPASMSTWTKVWKTGAALVSIAGAGAAVAAAWLATGASGGIGVPGALLVSGYSLNTIANKITDINNIWVGDQSKVGKVNYLKSGMAQVGGSLSEMLCGNRDVGEMIGKGVYTVGNFANAVLTARSISVLHGGGSALTSKADDFKNGILEKMPSNQIKQYVLSDMFDYTAEVLNGEKVSALQKVMDASTGNTFIDTGVKALQEIPTAAKGYLDIAFNSPLGSLRYDTTMLGYQIENLTKCVSFYKSSKGIYDLVNDTSKLLFSNYGNQAVMLSGGSW